MPIHHGPPDRLAISDYGLLGDGLTAALVGRDGSIGWLCAPRFDSPSIFASILDVDNGGWCSLGPADHALGRQHYSGRTNVLVTDFGPRTPHLRLIDWMPIRFGNDPESQLGSGAICRRVQAMNGDLEVEFCCAPRFNYGQTPARWRHVHHGLWETENLVRFWVASDVLGPAQPDEDGGLFHRFLLRSGEVRDFVLAWGKEPPIISPEIISESMRKTHEQWEQWSAQAQYEGPHADLVLRSALVLKALIYEPTGAIVAAPTTSLPEGIGGVRNWDYRYCWPRDATFALYGLSLLGYHEEAGKFLEFIAHISHRHELPLQVCYRVDGDAWLPERELPHLRGYRSSRPVRVGNGAVNQLQLDIYGEILDAAYTYAKWRGGLEEEFWARMRKLVDYVSAHWREPDNGIWEVRGGCRDFVYSKTMCWVAVDRALKMSERYGLKAPTQRWTALRDRIRHDIYARGYNHDLRAFTQYYSSDVADASVLLLPLVRFTHPREPRMHSTIRAVQQRLANSSLVARYENPHEDGVGGREGAFLICSFWLIDCLTLLGETGESRELFEHVVGAGNSLGLFSEEVDVTADGAPGEMLGNFPQAFTHMALINSAHNLQLYPKGVPMAGHHDQHHRERKKA